MTTARNKKRALTATACIVTSAVLVLLLASVSCSSQSDTATSRNAEPQSCEAITQDDLSGAIAAEEDAREPTAIGSEEVQEEGPTDTEVCVAQEPIDSIQSVSLPYDEGGQAQPSPSTPQKHWVEDTEQVWVEETAAWTEQEPIYGTKEVSICNICNTDVTGNTTAHGKAHMLAGEGSGHHSETRQTLIGFNTVSHPATGHWETRVIGGHWE